MTDTIINSDNGDISIAKLVKQIERAKTEKQKNELFLSVYGEDRELLVQHMILSMPEGKYLLKREGYAAPSLEREIINKYGVIAGTSNLDKTIRGLSVTNPDKVSADFTLGLDQITLKKSSKTKATRLPSERYARISQRGASISRRMPRISNRMGKLR